MAAAACNCGVAADQREAAVREVAEAYELIKLQQPLLLLLLHPPSQLAQSLLGKALRALNVALSVMKQQQPPAVTLTPIISVVKAEPHLISPAPPSPASADSQSQAITARGAKRRRSSLVAMEGKKNKKKASSSWAYTTAMPYDDGYEWRKYGEKKINGTLFTRSYFRCTYRDDAHCPATKHVQQMDNNSSSTDNTPMFHVTYNNDHTCNNNTTTTSAKANNTGSSSTSNLAALLLAAADGCNNDMKQEPTAAAAMNMMMKQEQPPLVDPSAGFFIFPYDDRLPECQEPLLFPVSMQQQQQFCGAFRDDDGEIPSATGSCISGETSWDGYSGDMAAAQMAAASAGDDDDLHPFLLWDHSFMDC